MARVTASTRSSGTTATLDPPKPPLGHPVRDSARLEIVIATAQSSSGQEISKFVTHRDMGGVQEPTDLVPTPGAQRGHGVGHDLDLGDDAPGAAPDPVVGKGLDGLERGRRRVGTPSAGAALSQSARRDP